MSLRDEFEIEIGKRNSIENSLNRDINDDRQTVKEQMLIRLDSASIESICNEKEELLGAESGTPIKVRSIWTSFISQEGQI